ncbi:MAG TPA: type II secretion system protein GspJ [Geobacteraceae bacterium]
MSSIWRRDGFTLLELLIALTLLTLLAGTLYGTYFSLTAGRETATAGMERRRELANTLDLLRRELSATYYRREQKAADDKSPNRFRFLVEDRDRFGKPASIMEFTCLAPPRDDGAAASDQVALRYQPEEKDGRLWLARQARDLYLTGEPIRYPQMDELAGFLVECFDGSKWVKSWDTAINQGLPKLVRVTITVREGERTVDYTTIATLRVQV